MKFPIGGTVREPFGRTGAIPVPTVTVWMEEDDRVVFARSLPLRPEKMFFGSFFILLRTFGKEEYTWKI